MIVTHGPTFGQIAGDLIERLANGLIVGHNVAWQSQFADQNVANRHSLILERQKLNAKAVLVAERGLRLPDSDYREPLENRVARCRKRLGAG